MNGPKRARDIQRRPIKVAFHWPPTTPEHEAIFALGRVPARMQLYEGGEPQPIGAARALGAPTDARMAGDRIVVTCEWRGVDDPPAELLEIIGFHEEPRKVPALRYAGLGRRSA